MRNWCLCEVTSLGRPAVHLDNLISYRRLHVPTFMVEDKRSKEAAAERRVVEVWDGSELRDADHSSCIF